MSKIVRYPYTNLKKHHSHYLKVVEDFFKSTYDVWFYISLDETKIIIKIYEVSFNKVYNPMNFEPCYRVKTRDGSDTILISSYDFFNSFYNYLPDIVPYLEVELYVPRDFINIYRIDESHNPNGCFETFNFREQYYMESTRYQWDNTF